jgi:hypothetical protein
VTTAPQSDADVRNLVDAVLQDSLRGGDLLDEVEELEDDKELVQGIPNSFWAVGIPAGDSEKEWILTVESRLPAFVAKLKNYEIVNGQSLRELFEEIDNRAGAPRGTTKIFKAFGSPILGPADACSHIIGNKIPDEAALFKHLEACKEPSFSYDYTFRVTTCSPSKLMVLPELSDLVSMIGLAEEYECMVHAWRPTKELTDEIRRMLSIGSGYAAEVIRDDLKFGVNHNSVWVKKMSKRELATVKRAAGRDELRAQRCAANHFVATVRSEITRVGEAYLQKMLPDWARPRASSIEDLRKILRRLKKLNALRKRPEYKAIFTSSTASADVLAILEKKVATKMRCGERIDSPDKFARFVAAEVKRLKKIK